MSHQLLTEDRRNFFIGALLAVLMLIAFSAGLWIAPVDGNQGEVYRIIYLHVPSAFAAFLAALVLCAFSIIALIKTDEHWLTYQRACSEVGLVFTIICLATGAIWGKPTWGVWWTWDARLTTTLLLAILYAGYLLLYNALSPGRQRIRICSVLGIIIFIDVPIIYQSVTWWRTLHQPPTLLRSGGSTIDPDMKFILLSCIFTVLGFAVWLIRQRSKNIRLKDELEQESYARLN